MDGARRDRPVAAADPSPIVRSMSEPVRTAAIGLGAIGTRIVAAFAAHPQHTLVAVCDTSGARADAVARQHAVPAYTDHAAMLAAERPALVYVAVPPRFHRDVVADVVASGAHVLCEKPLALSAADGRDMLARAEQAGRTHALNIGLHYDPGIRLFLAELAKGWIGDVVRIAIDLVFPEWPRQWQRNDWIAKREQGGPVRECTPHLFHVLRRGFGEVARLRADVRYGAEPDACERSANGVLELSSGLLVDVRVLTNVPRAEEVRLTVYGERGTLGLEGWRRPVSAKERGPLEPMSVPAASDPFPVGTELALAVRGEAADLVTFADGIALQRIQDAWDEAARSGLWVTVSDRT